MCPNLPDCRYLAELPRLTDAWDAVEAAINQQRNATTAGERALADQAMSDARGKVIDARDYLLAVQDKCHMLVVMTPGTTVCPV